MRVLRTRWPARATMWTGWCRASVTGCGRYGSSIWRYARTRRVPGCLFREMGDEDDQGRSEEHTSELQSLMRTSYAVFGLKKKTGRTARPLQHAVTNASPHKSNKQPNAHTYNNLHS